jgi:hypothetical protein
LWKILLLIMVKHSSLFNRNIIVKMKKRKI